MSAMNKRYGVAKQSAWGTAIADNAAVIELDCEHTIVEAAYNVRENPGAHGTRSRRTGDVVTDTKGVMPTFKIAGVVKKDEFPNFLYACIQQVSEAATTPYAKTFTFLTSQPAFLSDAGYFFTFFERDPEAAQTVKVTDCIVKTLKLSCESGGRLMYEAECVGRAAIAYASDPSGTWTRQPTDITDYFFFEHIDTVTADFGAGAQALTLKSFELTLGHNDITGVGHDGAGNKEYPALSGRKVEGSITVVKDAQTQSARAAIAANTVIGVQIAWGDGTADGDLTIDFDCKLSDVKHDNDNGIYGAQWAFEALDDSSDTTYELLKVIAADAVDRSW